MSSTQHCHLSFFLCFLFLHPCLPVSFSFTPFVNTAFTNSLFELFHFLTYVSSVSFWPSLKPSIHPPLFNLTFPPWHHFLLTFFLSSPLNGSPITNPLGCSAASVPGFFWKWICKRNTSKPLSPCLNGRLEPCSSIKSTNTQSHDGASQAGTGVRWSSSGMRLDIRQKK